MLDENLSGELPTSELSVQALLYASGEMEPSEAAAFERRLGEDQLAREALCQAVEIAQLASGQAPAAPDPAYRDRVRQKLRQRRRQLRNLAGQPSAFGPAALWVALITVAAVLLMLVFSHMAALQHHGPATAPATSPVKQGSPEPSQGPDVGPPAMQVKTDDAPPQP